MAGSVNKVILVGNLGRDPELRKTPGGAAVTSFTLATTDKYTDKNGQKHEQTEWHNIVCWNRLAEISAQYLKKGSSVFIEGKLSTRSWEDNGQKKYKTEIIASGMQMLDKIGGQGGGFGGGQNQGGFQNQNQGFGGNQGGFGGNQGGYQSNNRTAGFGGDQNFGEPPMDSGFGGDDFGGFPDSGFGGGFGGSAPMPNNSAPRYNAPSQPAPVAPSLPVEDDLPF